MKAPEQSKVLLLKMWGGLNTCKFLTVGRSDGELYIDGQAVLCHRTLLHADKGCSVVFVHRDIVRHEGDLNSHCGRKGMKQRYRYFIRAFFSVLAIWHSGE